MTYNLPTINYTSHSYEQGKSLLQFFKYCKEHQLHKPLLCENASRLNSLYTGNEICTGVEAIIAYWGNEPIAITLVEKREQHKEKATNSETGCQSCVYNLGRIHFYIKEDYRQQGIATHLLRKIEIQCLLKMMEYTEHIINIIPIFIAQEKSHFIVQANSRWVYPIQSDIPSVARQRELDKIKKNNDENNSMKSLYSNFYEKFHN